MEPYAHCGFYNRAARCKKILKARHRIVELIGSFIPDMSINTHAALAARPFSPRRWRRLRTNGAFIISSTRHRLNRPRHTLCAQNARFAAPNLANAKTQNKSTCGRATLKPGGKSSRRQSINQLDESDAARI